MAARVSVVIPCFNAGPWIAKTIESVLEQDWPEKDVIVVDDGSTDNSVARAQAFGDRITLLTGPNRGACHARNTGHRIATERGSDYIVFLDADDYFEGPILSGAVSLAEDKGADMVLSNLHLEYERADGSSYRELRYLYSGQVKPEEFFKGWMSEDYVSPPGVLWRTGFVTEIGGWDESLARAQDLDITLRAMLYRPVIWKNDQGAAIYVRVNQGSISRSQSRKALESRFRAVSGLVERIRGTSFAPIIPLMCQEIYHIARAAFRAGYRDLGRQALAFARAEGYRDHPGTRAHALLARIVGLENKVRIWKA